MWNLKYDTNELTKQKQTHRHRKQIYGYQRVRGEIRSLGLADTNYYIQNKQQGPTV